MTASGFTLGQQDVTGFEQPTQAQAVTVDGTPGRLSAAGGRVVEARQAVISRLGGLKCGLPISGLIPLMLPGSRSFLSALHRSLPCRQAAEVPDLLPLQRWEGLGGAKTKSFWGPLSVPSLPLPGACGPPITKGRLLGARLCSFCRPGWCRRAPDLRARLGQLLIRVTRSPRSSSSCCLVKVEDMTCIQT